MPSVTDVVTARSKTLFSSAYPSPSFMFYVLSLSLSLIRWHWSSHFLLSHIIRFLDLWGLMCYDLFLLFTFTCMYAHLPSLAPTNISSFCPQSLVHSIAKLIRIICTHFSNFCHTFLLNSYQSGSHCCQPH